MPDLLRGLQPGRSTTLTSDLLRTAISAPLTFGAHAIKGMTLGLLDPTDEVSEILGEDIYQAAPKWARGGAELVGEFAPIMGALGAARRVVPGMTVLPRFMQGMLAGGTLGTIRGAVEGEDLTGIATHALTEGLLFGAVEGAFGIPALIKERRLTNLFKTTKNLTPFEVGAPDLAISPEAHAAAQDVQAYRYRTSPSPATVARTQRGPLPEAQLVDQGALESAMAGVWTDETHGLYGQKLVLQMWEDGEIKTLDGFISKVDKASVTFEDIAGQRQVRLTPRHLFNPHGSPDARFMRGQRMTHALPQNADLDMRAARQNYQTLVDRLRKDGQLSDNQSRLFLEYVQPRAKGIMDLSLSEVNVLTRLMRRGAAGAPGEKVLPTVLDDVIGFMGEEARNVNIGAWSWAQPAHLFIEAHTKKLGGVRWLKDIHKAFLYAGVKTKEFKILTAEKFSSLAQKGVKGMAKYRPAGLFHGISAEQRDTIPSLIYRIRQASAKFAKTPAFRAERMKIIQAWEQENAKKWSKQTAAKLRENYVKFASHRDQLILEMESTGYVDMSKYHKDLMPFLASMEETLENIFPKWKQLPKHVKDLMTTPELGASEADLYKMLDRMTSNYTKVMFTRPAKQFMDLELKGRKVHTSLKRWLSHYADRQRGIPSEVDRKLATSMKTAFKKVVPREMPILGEYAHKFTNNDWMKVSVFFNDMPYLAHLGLRPFSAMRNLLQPMLTTGPMIGNRWLAKGYHDAGTNRALTKWIRDNGLLQQSLGEYEMRLSLSPRKLDQFGKFMMGMFRKTDEINRFASGLGMRAKFNHFWALADLTNAKGMEAFYTNIKLRRFRPTTRKDVRNLGRAYRAADELATYNYPKGSKRVGQLQDEIRRLTGTKNITPTQIEERMRLKVVGDAIGDTQWLYGKEHAPIFTHAGGFVGRQMGVYQTWWLNYAHMMKRFMFDYPSKIGGSRDFAPLGMWAANNIMIGLAFVGLGWEATKVFRTVGLGPFPTELPIDPPGVQPFRHAAQAFGNLFFRLDSEAAEKNMATALRRAWDNWVPGSLVYKEMSKVGWAPHQWARGPGQLRYGDIKLTPEAKYAGLTPQAKIASVLGGRGRGRD